MTQHKDMERAKELFHVHCKNCDGLGELEKEFDFFECEDCKGTGELALTPEIIASLIAQVRNETLDAVDKMIEAQADFYFSFSNELDDYESKLAQSHFDMAKRIRNLKQEDKE